MLGKELWISRKSNEVLNVVEIKLTSSLTMSRGFAVTVFSSVRRVINASKAQPRDMFSPPSPSAGRGDLVLQPNYFTSSVYVEALRDDISKLISRYHDEYHKTIPGVDTKPFTLFKKVWEEMGWKWLHFMVFDARPRQTFLDVTLRIFLGELLYVITA